MHDTIHSTRARHAVDNTDWLKTAAIMLVSVDHIGHYFIENDLWWSAFGRLAAPPFFFLMGYAQTRVVPLHWIGLGIILTLLESWNASWNWVTVNILLSFALIRLARPYVEIALQRYSWAAFALLVLALVAALPIARPIVDYGAEGWLWALLGLCQRMFVDDKSQAGTAPRSAAPGLMRLLACVAAVAVYLWQEQREYSFPQIQFAVVVAGVGVLAAILCLFRRGPSYIQPPEPVGGLLRFIGRRTLEIYAIQLAASEIITLLRAL
jgi:TraX protein